MRARLAKPPRAIANQMSLLTVRLPGNLALGLARKMTPSSKPPSHHRKLNIPMANMEHGADINETGVDNMEIKESEQKCVKLGDY